MSRQRTINDQAFWRSPRLQVCTTEDKIALLHLLSCPDSNIAGAYALVPRIASAEVGWSAEQWLQVIDRLCAINLAWFDAEHMFIWVRIWWDHHHAGQSMGQKLRNRTLADIRRIPEPWLQPFLHDFRQRLPVEYREILDREFNLQHTGDTSEIAYGYGIDTSSNLSLGNSNAKNITITPTLASPSLPVDISGIPSTHQPELTRVLKRAHAAGRTATDLNAIVETLVVQFRSKTKPPRNAAAVAHYLLNQGCPPAATNQLTAEKLSELHRRCFIWPPGHSESYARIDADGTYELIRTEQGNVTLSIGQIERSGLLTAIDSGSAVEVQASKFEGLMMKMIA